MKNLVLEGLYDGHWFLHNGKPIIVLFGRNKDGEKYVYIEENFKPYFVVLEEEAKQRQIFNNYKIEKIEKEDVMSGRKDLVKIVYNNPSQTYDLRGRFDKHWEADILFVNRFVIDNVKQEHGNNKFFYFDIETTTTYGFPNYQNPIEQIISISLYNNHTNRYILWIWHPSYKRKMFKTQNEKVEYEVRRFESEKSMLIDFFQYVVNEKPDYFLAWNVKFDWNYIIARLKVLGFNIEMLSPLFKLKVERGWNTTLAKHMTETAVATKTIVGEKTEGYWKIVGLEFFDLLQGFRNTYGKEMESFSLDAVANEILGERKLGTHFDIEKKWREDPSFIEKYNIIDTYLIVEIDKKMGIMKRFMGFKVLSNLLILRDAFASGRILDNFILTKFKDKYVFPSKKQISWDKWQWGNKVTGGFVMQPNPGLYRNVVVFDFSGMYPNIIKTFNLGADSLVDYEFDVVDKDAEEFVIKPELPEKFDGWIHLNTQKIRGKIKINFSKKAVMTQILDEMIAARKKVKKERDQYEPGTPEYEALDILQFSYKFVINSVGPDTLVPVRKKGVNKLEWVKIKDLEGCWWEYETLVNVPNTNRFEWCEIKDFIKEKPADGKIVEIKTKYNYKIKLSTNHSIYVLENGKEVMKKGEELKVGDKVVVLNLSNTLKPQKLNLIQILKDDVDYIVKLPFNVKYNVIEIINKLCRDGCLYRNSELKTLKELEKLGYIEQVWEYVGRGNYKKKWVVKDKEVLSFFNEVLQQKQYKFKGKKRFWKIEYNVLKKFSTNEEVLKYIFVTNKRNKKKVITYPVLLDVDDVFIKMVAFYVSEGSVSSTYNSISLSQKDNRFENVVKEFCRKYGIKWRKINNNYLLYSKIFAILFSRLCGIDSKNKKLPDFVYWLDHEKLKLLWLYLIKGDGCEGKYTYTYNTISKILTNQLTSLFNCRISKEKLPTGNVIYHLYLNKKDFENGSFVKKKRYIEIVDVKIKNYDGYLYDLTVPPYYDFIGGEVGVFRLRDSSYGVNAYPSFRLFSPIIANAITTLGRMMVKWVGKSVEERFGWKWFYSDSVTGNMKVYLKDRIVTFDELWDELSKKQKPIEINGKQYILKPPIKIPCFNEKEDKVVYCEPKYLMRHKNEKKVYRIYFNSHDYIEVTEDHSLLTVKDGKLVEVTPKEIKIGDYLPIGNLEFEEEEIDWLWFLLGLFLADGSVNKHSYYDYYYINFSGCINLFEFLKTKFNKHLDYHVHKNNFDITLRKCVIYDRLLELIRKYNLLNKKSVNISLPNELLGDLEGKRLLSFILGIWFGDGSIISDRLVFNTASKKFAEQIKYLLFKLGLPALIQEEKDSRGNYWIDKDKHTGEMYRVSVKNSDKLFQIIKKYNLHILKNNNFSKYENLTKSKWFGRCGYKRAEEFNVTRKEKYKWFENIRPVKVEKIEIVEYDGYVYDFETPFHNFFVENILVHNTDSCFFLPNESYDLSKEEDKQKLMEKVKKVEEFINKVAIPDFLKRQLPPEQVENATTKMELAEIFDKLILITKKKYIGRIVNKEGKWTDKLFYMGLDAKKANNPQIVKDAQLEVAKAILYNEDWKKVVDKYYNIFKTATKEELIELLKLPTKLEKPIEEYKANTPTIRGVLWSNRYLKTNFRAGNKFFGIYVKSNSKINENFVCFENISQLKNSEYWEALQIDLEKYIDMLYTKLSFVLEPAGLNEYNEKKKNELLNEIRWQNGLGRWL